MKTNAYLTNARKFLCDAVNGIKHGRPHEALRDAIQAITELDSFTHGRLQQCDHCPDKPIDTDKETGP